MQDHVQARQATLLTRIGGAEAVDTLVGALYFNILNDPRLARFFDNVPVNRVVTHQRQFLIDALGGGSSAAGSYGYLAQVHRHLIENQGLNPQHFDALLENLQLTLRDLDVPETEAQEVIAVLAATKAQIFG